MTNKKPEEFVVPNRKEVRKVEEYFIGALAFLVLVGSISLVAINKINAEPDNLIVEKRPETSPVIEEIPEIEIPEVVEENNESEEENETEEEIIEEEEIEEEEMVEEEPEEEIEEEVKEYEPHESYTYSGAYADCGNMNFANLDESDWLIKYEDDEYASILGIDISEYNGNVNFYKLKEIGIDFVMLRVGWRGYTEGGIYKDQNFDAYYEEAADAGLNIGYYFFSQALNEDEAVEEANFVLDQIAGKKCDMFVAFDMESSGGSEGRIYYMSKAERTDAAIAFVETIENAGYSSMIYTNHDWAVNYFNMGVLDAYNIWYAQYDGYPHVNFGYAMWQYTASASVAGIPNLRGRTDLNLMLIKK